MARCPKCGREVANPRKIWKMAGRPDRTGKMVELTIGLFDCPLCKMPFRYVLSKRELAKLSPEEKPEEKRIVSKTLALREQANLQEVVYIKKSLKKETE